MRRNAGRSRLRRCERDGKRHVRSRSRDVELIEKRDEVRIGPVIEDEKTGIDAVGQAVERDVYRIGVAAEVAIGFEQGHVDTRIAVRHAVGARQS
jgi:hypothetical protein